MVDIGILSAISVVLFAGFMLNLKFTWDDSLPEPPQSARLSAYGGVWSTYGSNWGVPLLPLPTTCVVLLPEVLQEVRVQKILAEFRIPRTRTRVGTSNRLEISIEDLCARV